VVEEVEAAAGAVDVDAVADAVVVHFFLPHAFDDQD
jgi:hypothetical protein